MQFSLWIVLLLCAMAFEAQATDLQCRVVGISDGDTFTCLAGSNQQVKVRMANIDTPESGQPYGRQAKDLLASLIFGRAIQLKLDGQDKYGRQIGQASVDGVSINREMVARGAAWVFDRYNRDTSLPVLQGNAQKARLGLWALPESDIIPPWEWRKAGRQLHALVAEHRARGADAACDTKRYCGQMSNCQEAKFYLRQCGVSSLDRDLDGVPCESLCR